MLGIEKLDRRKFDFLSRCLRGRAAMFLGAVTASRPFPARGFGPGSLPGCSAKESSYADACDFTPDAWFPAPSGQSSPKICARDDRSRGFLGITQEAPRRAAAGDDSEAVEWPGV